MGDQRRSIFEPIFPDELARVLYNVYWSTQIDDNFRRWIDDDAKAKAETRVRAFQRSPAGAERHLILMHFAHEERMKTVFRDLADLVEQARAHGKLPTVAQRAFPAFGAGARAQAPAEPVASPRLPVPLAPVARHEAQKMLATVGKDAAAGPDHDDAWPENRE